MMTLRQERVMWSAVMIAIIMLLFPPYYNHFAADPAHYPGQGNPHNYGFFLSTSVSEYGVDMAVQMAQLGILGLLTTGYIFSLGVQEPEARQREPEP